MSGIIGEVLGHTELDVIWIPHLTFLDDGKGHRVRRNAPHLDKMLDGTDYFRIKAWVVQEGEEYEQSDPTGVTKVKVLTLRVACDQDAFREANAVYSTRTGQNRERIPTIQDVIVFDYLTHTVQSKAYEIKAIYDSCKQANMMRLVAAEVGIYDMEFLRTAL
jgi:hypothetical protein